MILRPGNCEPLVGAHDDTHRERTPGWTRQNDDDGNQSRRSFVILSPIILGGDATTVFHCDTRTVTKREG